jgi:hypothetical protein
MNSPVGPASSGRLCNRLHNSANGIVCNQLHETNVNRCNRSHESAGLVGFYAASARFAATQRAYKSDMAAFTAWGGRGFRPRRR